jgi:hypothetical protein
MLMGDPGSELVTLRLPDLIPEVVGVNLIVRSQRAPGARVAALHDACRA